MKVALVVRSGKHSGQQILINRSQFLIGRAEECHLRPRSEAVSRLHCALLIEPGRVTLKDYGSKNGTFVNGQRVNGECLLKSGDLLQVADLSFEFRWLEEPVPAGSAKPTGVASSAQSQEKSAEPDLAAFFGSPTDLAGAQTKAFNPSALAPTGRPIDDTAVNQLGLETVPARNEPAQPADNRPVSPEQVEIVGVAKGRWKPKAVNPREAAAEALRKFFGRT